MACAAPSRPGDKTASVHTRDENKTERDITIKNRAKERKKGGRVRKKVATLGAPGGYGCYPQHSAFPGLCLFFLATNKHDFKATTTETTQILCTQDKNKHKKKALNLENNTQNQNPLTELL